MGLICAINGSNYVVGGYTERRIHEERKLMLPYIPDVVPNIVVALVIVVAFVMAFAPALRKCPVVFYAVWIAACMATFVDIVRWIPWLYYVVQAFASCYTGVAFYLLVMFAGAFPKKWWFTKRLLSVRTEMSIIGGFVIFAHVIQVLIMVPLSFTPIWDKAWGGGLTSIIMFIAASVVGVPLTVCFFVPWITSFRTVRGIMEHSTWKKVQRLAYPFMALMVLQGILLSIGHAVYAQPGGDGFVGYVVNALAYAAIGAAYVALKLRRRAERRAKVVARQDVPA